MFLRSKVNLPAAPRRKKFHSGTEISSAFLMISTHSMKENTSLSFSNRPLKQKYAETMYSVLHITFCVSVISEITEKVLISLQTKTILWISEVRNMQKQQDLYLTAYGAIWLLTVLFDWFLCYLVELLTVIFDCLQCFFDPLQCILIDYRAFNCLQCFWLLTVLSVP